MSKFRAGVVGLAVTALVMVPASADAKSKKRAKSAKAAPTLLLLKTQILQPSSGCALLGTKGTILLDTPVELCL